MRRVISNGDNAMNAVAKAKDDKRVRARKFEKIWNNYCKRSKLLPRGPLSWIVSSQRSSLKHPPTFPPQSTLSCD